MRKIVIHKKRTKFNLLLIGAFIAFILFDELYFRGRELYITPIIGLFLLLFDDQKIKINTGVVWIILLSIYTSLIGVKLSDNTENFSLLYNIVSFLNILNIYLLFLKYSEDFFYILKNTLFFTTIITSFFIFLSELPILRYRWTDYLKGHIGYRLGLSSDINPNTIAWLFGILGMLTLFLYIHERHKTYLFLIVLQVIFILLSGSKAGLLFMLIPILYYGIKSLFTLNIKITILIILAIGILWFSIQHNPLLYTLVGKRIDEMLLTLGIGRDTAGVSVDATSTLKRIDMLETAWGMFAEKPIFGWGIGAFAKFGGYGYYSHNTFLELLVSGGIIGFIIYYGYLLLLSITIFLKEKSKMKDMLLILIISLILSDMITVTFYSRIVFYFRTILILIVLSLNTDLEKS